MDSKADIKTDDVRMKNKSKVDTEDGEAGSESVLSDWEWMNVKENCRKL